MARRKVTNAEISEVARLHAMNDKIANKHYQVFISYYNKLTKWSLTREITNKQKNILYSLYLNLSEDIYGAYKNYTIKDISKLLATPPKLLLGTNFNDFLTKSNKQNKEYLLNSSKESTIKFIDIFESKLDRNKEIAIEEYNNSNREVSVNDIILKNANLHAKAIIPISIANFVYQKATTIRMNDGELLSGYNGNILKKKSSILKTVMLAKVIKKQWVTQFINSRETHIHAHGQVVLLDDKFKVGSEEAEYPRAKNLSPKESYNCKCEIILTS